MLADSAQTPPGTRCALVRALGDQALFDKVALADLTETAQFGETDNSVVGGYPSFSPFGIDGAYYY